MVEHLDPKGKPAPWENKTNRERVVWCVKFLDEHGFLSEREGDWIMSRVRQWVLAHSAAQN